MLIIILCFRSFVTNAALLDPITGVDSSFERIATIAELVVEVFSVVVDGRVPRIGVTEKTK